MIHKCPKCGSKLFTVTAHVTQDWIVDEYGNFVKCLQECVETTHFPNDEDLWECSNCGYNAAGAEFLTEASPEPTDPVSNENIDPQRIKIEDLNLSYGSYLALQRAMAGKRKINRAVSHQYYLSDVLSEFKNERELKRQKGIGVARCADIIKAIRKFIPEFGTVENLRRT